MKYRFFFILFVLLTFVSGAETVQIPVTLRNDRVKSGNARLFSIVLPLAPGALRDLKNLKLSDAEGREISSQSRILLRHASGDAAWVKVSGLISMGRSRSRKIFVEYGSDVLNSARRGIVHAVNGPRMLIDAGVVSAEFSLDRFALPDKVMVNGKDSGSFAPLPPARKSASVSIIESGALHTAVAVSVPEQPELGSYRVHFFYNLPDIRVEYIPGNAKDDNPVKFTGNGKVASAVERSGRFRVMKLDFSGKKAEIEPELTGIVPAWHLERAGVIPGDLPEFLKNFERSIVDDVKKFPKEYLPETLLEVFFRTGDLQLLKLAVDSPRPLSDRTGGTLLRAFGSTAALEKYTPARADISGGVVPTPEFIRGVEEFLGQKISCEKALRLGEILASGFDLNTGDWFRHIAVSGGASSGDHVGSRWRIRGLLCMMKLEALTRDRRFAGVIASGLRRVIGDDISGAFRRSSRQFELLTMAADFHLRYPEYSTGMSKMEILHRFAGENDSPLRFGLLPGMSVELVPGKSGTSAVVSCPEAAELAVCDRNGIKQFSANGAPEMLIPLAVSGTLLKYSGRAAADCSVKFSKSYRTGLPLGKFPLELRAAQFLKFSLELPGACSSSKLRIMPLIPGEWAELYLISPDNKVFCHRSSVDCNKSILSMPPLTLERGGIWQMFVHVSQGGAILSLEGNNGMLWR